MPITEKENLIIEFENLIHGSMVLDETEEDKYRELIQNHPDYKEVKMLESIEEVGIEKGIEKGKADIIARQIKRKFGDLSPELRKRLTAAKVETLDPFGEAIFDFQSLKDAEQWWEKQDKGRA